MEFKESKVHWYGFSLLDVEKVISKEYPNITVIINISCSIRCFTFFNRMYVGTPLIAKEHKGCLFIDVSHDIKTLNIVDLVLRVVANYVCDESQTGKITKTSRPIYQKLRDAYMELYGKKNKEILDSLGISKV